MKINKTGGFYGIGTIKPESYIQLNADSLWDAWKKLLRFTFIDMHIDIEIGKIKKICEFCEKEIDDKHKKCKMCGKIGCYNCCPEKVSLGTPSPCAMLKIKKGLFRLGSINQATEKFIIEKNS